MKTQNNSKPVQTGANHSDQRSSVRHSAAKTIEHRYERRKIREQLRHLDWVLADVD